MKKIFSLGLFFVLFARCEAEPVSIEAFKNIHSHYKRLEIMEQAPAEQKEVLQQIDIHMTELVRHGGEAGLQRAKESLVIEQRGLEWLEYLFHYRFILRERYIAWSENSYSKAGKTQEQLTRIVDKLEAHEKDLRSQLPTIQALIFKVAPSHRAVALAAKAKNYSMYLADSNRRSPVTKAEIIKCDQRIARFLKEIEALPKTTPEQNKIEYDVVTDIQVLQREGGGEREDENEDEY